MGLRTPTRERVGRRDFEAGFNLHLYSYSLTNSFLSSLPGQSPDASFERAKSWVQTLKRQADPGIVIMLVGNKIDLCSPSTNDQANNDGMDKRRVLKETAEKYAKEEGLLFAEASAKTGEGVSELFLEVGELVLSSIVCNWGFGQGG
jgi:GTPase SAR1 family protein